MRKWSQLRWWVRAVTRRSQMEREMDTELRFHIEAFAEDLVRGDVPQEEAMRRARIEFGGVERAKEECREARGIHLIDDLLKDLRCGLRVIRKHPNFALVVILILALGIGASTPIFAVAYGALFRPLPYPLPNQILTLWESNPKENLPQGQVSAANFYDWQRDNTVFSSMAAYAAWHGRLLRDPTLSGDRNPRGPRSPGLRHPSPVPRPGYPLRALWPVVGD